MPAKSTPKPTRPESLRKGHKWSDGQPITAKDVEFTYNLIMTNTDAATANGVAVTNYESVRATDDSTVVIRTKQPQASMLQSEIPIVPEHVWKDVKDIKNFKNSDKFPVVGSGPFVLTGYQEGQSVTLEANEKFWRGRPKIDKLQYVKYESTEAAVQGLRKGDVDLAYRRPSAAATSATVSICFSSEILGRRSAWAPDVAEAKLPRWATFACSSASSRDCARYSLTSAGTITRSIKSLSRGASRDPSSFESSSSAMYSSNSSIPGNG